MTRPRRVIVDCEKMRYPNTGLYSYCQNLGNALLQSTEPAKEEIIFYTPPSNPAPFGDQRNYKIIRKWHKLYIPSGGIDIWHCNYHESNYLPSRHHTRTLITIHDLNFLIDDKENKDKHLKMVQARVDRVDHVVCTSLFTEKTVNAHLALRGKKTEIVYDGCHVSLFPGFDQPVYRPAKPFIFTIGIFFPKKNFHVLPAMLKDNDYELVIAGKRLPEYEAVIMEHARRHQVEDRVKLVDSITEQDKYWYYLNCSAFAFPSLAEGFGLPVVEAMYFGKPLFLSSHTCLPEIGGDLASYFNTFEPEEVQSVFARGMSMHNEAQADRIRQRSKEFSWEKTAASYLRIYREL